MALNWRSLLIHPKARAPEGFHSLATPTYRGSTTILRTASDVRDEWDQARFPYRYGSYGTPTTLELAARIAELEGAKYCFITPGGQAAIALVYLAFARAGGHVLVPDSVYGPSRELADRLLNRLGIETEYYDPLIGGSIENLCKHNTQLIWCESPGSVTMEIQDIPAITKAAQRLGIVSALDNTYAAGVFFDAFKHGVDVSMQALTKYVGGHSDLLLGSVTVRDEQHYRALGDAHQLIGFFASPDDCTLALRGLQTLAVRLTQMQLSALEIAKWLRKQPEVETVLHPALPEHPGHELWKRDFTGSASVFSVVFKAGTGGDFIIRMIEALHLFKLGFSWGGVTSLVMRYEQLQRRLQVPAARIVRFNVGLEDVPDLINDLQSAFSVARSQSGGSRQQPA
jgi:cysteine-S-conjugate beta-lyase